MFRNPLCKTSKFWVSTHPFMLHYFFPWHLGCQKYLVFICDKDLIIFWKIERSLSLSVSIHEVGLYLTACVLFSLLNYIAGSFHLLPITLTKSKWWIEKFLWKRITPGILESINIKVKEILMILCDIWNNRIDSLQLLGGFLLQWNTTICIMYESP